MPEQPRSGASRGILRIGLFVILLLASSLSAALAHQATPAQDEETRLYIGHAGGFVSHIPDDWVPDRSLAWDYAGRDGFIMTRSISAETLGADTLDHACDTVARDDRYLDMAVTTLTTWRDQPACEIRVENDRDDDPVSVVFAHPGSGAQADLVWVVVTVDAAHVDDVVDNISFDTSVVTASMYLDSVLDILETRSLWRDHFDWPEIRQRVQQRLGGAADGTSLEVAAAPIRAVIDEMYLGGVDGHTLFVPAARMSLIPDWSASAPAGQALDGGVGYLAVPSFSGSPEQSQRFVAELHARISDQEAAASCGWIIDLRSNEGGQGVPMVMGVSPFLPPGPVVTTRNVAGDELISEMTADGAVANDGQVAEWQHDVALPPDPALSVQPVAVLIGPLTASAAEATAIAFIGRDNTAFFGEPSAALATSPEWFPLLDGSLLMVTSGWLSGPHGAIYPDGIAPDVTVSTGSPVEPIDDDPVVQAASEWLEQQPGC